MLMSNNYCALKQKPKACKKNLGISRINMPQINSPHDFKRYKKLLKNKLNLSSTMKQVPLSEPIFASQKEIHMQKARAIAKAMNRKTKKNNTSKNNTSKNKSKNKMMPILLLRDKKGNYLVVDGHHRWLAHHFLNRRRKTNKASKAKKAKKHTMRSYVTNVDKLLKGFKKINQTLRRDKHHFHKKHTFE